jgi:hypothetical protein
MRSSLLSRSALRASPAILDICYARDPENLDRFVDALTELRTTLRGVDPDAGFVLHARAIAAGDHFTFATSADDLDILGTPAGTHGFTDLDSNAVDVDLDDLVVRTATPDDLIRMKRVAGRPKDRIELEILGALRDELGGG